MRTRMIRRSSILSKSPVHCSRVRVSRRGGSAWVAVVGSRGAVAAAGRAGVWARASVTTRQSSAPWIRYAIVRVIAIRLLLGDARVIFGEQDACSLDVGSLAGEDPGRNSQEYGAWSETLPEAAARGI